MQALPDNIFWRAFTGPQARFALRERAASRYAPGFSPIVAFEDPSRPDFDALEALCAPGEVVYAEGLTAPIPPGWRVQAQTSMFAMVWNGHLVTTDATFAPVRLGSDHVERAVALAMLTRPGPFGPRTIELGEYFGLFDGDTLMAMAGERLDIAGFREVSGVCTHPQAQGRGYARRLMLHIVARQLGREQLPFLHVVSSNAAALALYRKMGFREVREVPVHVFARETPAA